MQLVRFIVLAFMVALLAACGQDGGGDQLEQVRQAYTKGFYLEAQNGYERYLQQNPRGEYRQEAWQRLLEIATNVTGNTDQAISLLEAMILEYGDDPQVAWELMTRLGELYEQTGQHPEALAALERSIEFAGVEPLQVVETKLVMARIHRSQGDYGLAVDMLRDCADAAGSLNDERLRILCLYEEAQTYTFMQSWGQAKEVLEVLLDEDVPDSDPDSNVHARAIFLLADVYEQQMDFERARELYESISDTYPNPMVIEIRLKNLGKTKP